VVTTGKVGKDRESNYLRKSITNMKRNFLVYKREYSDYGYKNGGNNIYYVYTHRFYITPKWYIDLDVEFTDRKY
jgi:hypothetical protein